MAHGIRISRRGLLILLFTGNPLRPMLRSENPIVSENSTVCSWGSSLFLVNEEKSDEGKLLFA